MIVRKGCCSSPRQWFSGDAEERQKSIPGAATPVGWYFQYQELLCVTTTALIFLSSCTRCRTAAAGGTYIRGCGYRGPAGTIPARNGEVWTSPRRESPRRGPSSQLGPCRQGLKLIPAAAARLNMLEDCGPLRGAALTPAAAQGRNWANTAGDCVTVPAPGRRYRRARNKGPPMLPNPHQITETRHQPGPKLKSTWKSCICNKNLVISSV